MSFFWKVFWTVIIIICGAAAMYGVVEFFNVLFNGPYDLSIIIPLIIAGLGALPAWFAWKGTKLVPLLTNFVVRVVMIVVGCFFPPLLVVFALIGIWLKS